MLKVLAIVDNDKNAICDLAKQAYSLNNRAMAEWKLTELKKEHPSLNLEIREVGMRQIDKVLLG